MNEIMIIGDSLNYYSMLSMDFGITVAIGNGCFGEEVGGSTPGKEPLDTRTKHRNQFFMFQLIEGKTIALYDKPAHAPYYAGV